MSNQVGVIFHNNWEEFSPLLYSFNGGNCIAYQLQDFLCNTNLSSDDCEKVSVDFIKQYDNITRISNLTEAHINTIITKHKYYNYFDEGVWFVNISADNFGKVLNENSKYFFENNNIVNDLINSEMIMNYRKER